MTQSTRVLLLTTEPAIQNLVEQVCLIDGYRTVTAATVEDAHALAAQRGRDAFVLGVIDTAALGASDQQQQHAARQLWQDWSAAYPRLPLMFVGTRSPNYDFVAHRPDIGGFLEKPFGPYVLADRMRTFLPG
jgi:DNA-binding response OmpR family regulator